jgi:hypothetical protein
VLFLLPVKEDGIEEDDEASAFYLTGAEKYATGNVVFLLLVKEDGIEEDDEASVFIYQEPKNLPPGNGVSLTHGGWNIRRRRGERFLLTGAEKSATRQRGVSLTHEGGWNRRRRRGERFFNLLEPKNMRSGNGCFSYP